MLFWMLSGLGVAAVFGFFIIRNAEADDKRRKTGKRAAIPNTWK